MIFLNKFWRHFWLKWSFECWKSRTIGADKKNVVRYSTPSIQYSCNFRLQWSLSSLLTSVAVYFLFFRETLCCGSTIIVGHDHTAIICKKKHLSPNISLFTRARAFRYVSVVKSWAMTIKRIITCLSKVAGWRYPP